MNSNGIGGLIGQPGGFQMLRMAPPKHYSGLRIAVVSVAARASCSGTDPRRNSNAAPVAITPDYGRLAANARGD